MKSVIYVLVREELRENHRFDGSGMDYTRFNEKAFQLESDALQYKHKLDPVGKGFDYQCPCGCGDKHYRSWDIECVAFEE